MKVLLAAVAILAAITHGHEIEKRQAHSNTANKVVCYYTNWSVYRKGLAKYTPQNINPYLCTHLVYAFGGLTDEFKVGPFDKYQDIEQGGYAKFNGLKQYNKGLKTLLAIGGWNEGSGRFSELVALPEYRRTFIISAIKHLRRYNFDGLDLDWEYPASRDGSAPEDKENYAILVKELREAFNDEGRKVSKGRLLLTMAVPAGQNYIDKGYDVPSLTRDLDFINILNYDYHSAYEPQVNHHATLMPAPGTSEYEWNAQLNVDWTVKYYIKLGADKHKLVIGIPTYGRSYTLIDGNYTDLGASADGPGEQGKYTRENGFMAFYEVCENIASNGWEVRKPFPRRIGPYAFSGNQWVGYDDEKIAARKAEYVKEHGLGGIMFWSLDNDDFRGICNGEEYPLIEAGKKALFAESETSIQVSTATTAGTRIPPRLSTRLRDRPTRPSQSRTTTTTTQRPSQRTTLSGATRRRRPHAQGGRRRHSTTTIDPLNTPAPPTTPSPVQSFLCKREGFYPNPDDCHKYYWCLDSGTSGLGIVAHAFTCPSGLVFNKVIDGCDHADRTKCNTDKKGRGGGAGNTTPGSTTAIPTTTEIPVDYDYLYDTDYYYYDDEYYYDDAFVADEPVEEVPNSVSRQFQNSGGSQFQGGSSPVGVVEETPSSSGSPGQRNRPQYTSISRERPAAAESPREETPSRQQTTRGSQRPQYTSIQRERPVTQPPREEDRNSFHPTTSSGRNYVTIERRRPDTQADDAVTREEPDFSVTTEPTLEYVTLSRNRERTTPSSSPASPFPSDLRTRDSISQGLVDTTTTPRYVTLQRNRSSTTEETPTFFEETTIPTTPIDDQTTGPVRFRTPHPPTTPGPTVPPSFNNRPRTARPQLETRPTRPQSGTRPNRFQSARPTQPQSDVRRTRPQSDVRRTRPQSENRRTRPRPTQEQDDARLDSQTATRPTRPLIVPRPRPITTLLPVVFEEETVNPLEDDYFIDTTIIPETSSRPSLISFSPRPRPQPTTPAPRPTTPSPRPTTPAPRPTTLAPRPTTPAPRPTTPAPRPTTPAPRPTTPAPRPTTQAPRIRSRPSSRPRPRGTTRRPTTSRPRPRSPRPLRPAVTRAPNLPQSPAPSAILGNDGNDYFDYYYQDLDGALTGTLGQLATLTDKAVLMADGSVQCYDTGYFAHPDSCKKFISCSKTVRGLVRGWVYTCPEQLVFDPVGGMCNWAETVDCAGKK